jgi:hypothetical protein
MSKQRGLHVTVTHEVNGIDENHSTEPSACSFRQAAHRSGDRKQMGDASHGEPGIAGKAPTITENNLVVDGFTSTRSNAVMKH